MQLSDISKAFNFFVAGALIVIAVLVVEYRGQDPLALASGVPSGVAILAAALLLPVAMFAGFLVEGCASFIRDLLQAAGRWRTIAGVVRVSRSFLRVNQEFKNHEMARKRFVETLADRSKTNVDVCENGSARADAEMLEAHKQLAVSILFGSGPGEVVQWVTSHYSTYVLCTNFALLTPVVLYLVNERWQLALWQLALALLFALYVLTHLALQKAYYAYEVSFRQGAIALMNEANKHLTENDLRILLNGGLKMSTRNRLRAISEESEEGSLV